jgi:hypothetical protein
VGCQWLRIVDCFCEGVIFLIQKLSLITERERISEREGETKRERIAYRSR